MIGFELEIERLEDGVTLSFNPQTDDFVVELSFEAFDALVRALENASQQAAG